MSGGLDPRGPAAHEIAGLWWLMFWVGLAVFLVFAGVLAYAMLRGRRSNGHGEGRREALEQGERYVRLWVVGLGVVMTTVVLVVVLIFTIASMRAIPNAVGENRLVLDLVAHQWFWRAHYPAYGITTRDVVHIPANRPVELRLSSADVIHSFWVPQLAGKMDALPDKTNTLLIEADEPGTYRGQCAEFCGLYHARMRVTVVAMPADEFEAWVDRAQ